MNEGMVAVGETEEREERAKREKRGGGQRKRWIILILFFWYTEISEKHRYIFVNKSLLNISLIQIL